MTPKSRELDEALKELRDAVEDEGPQPEYHRAVMGKVETQWPTLMQAVRLVVRASR